MSGARSWGKDHFGALLVIAIGVAVLVLGFEYRLGTLSHMGAGFIPAVLGCLMIAVGIALGVGAIAARPSAGLVVDLVADLAQVDQHASAEGSPGSPWRGWVCILGGVVAFVTFGEYGGLVPATFFAVFVAALGDRENTWKSAAAVAAVMVVFGTIVFHFGLKLQLPLFRWG